jgi:hypothetical protein
MVSNACATQAILSILLNASGTFGSINIGRELEKFREFTSAFSPTVTIAA